MFMNLYDDGQIPYVASVSISNGGIPKKPVDSVMITAKGLTGDGHNHEKHNNPNQAVCLQDVELLEKLCQEGFPLACGSIGENLAVRHLDVQHLIPGTILTFSGGVILELTKERKPCYVLDAIDPKLKEAIVGRCGYYAKVLRGGMLRVGAAIHVKRPLTFQASQREYQVLGNLPTREI
jgi:MOSC domain-containing protein YiiM